MKTASAVTWLVVFGLFLAFAETARADHLFATEKEEPNFPAGPNRINLLVPCLLGMSDISYPANTGFFVAHGWVTNIPWADLGQAQRRAFMSPATRFDLLIDGELQPSALHAGLQDRPFGTAMAKGFVTEDHDGLTGTHTFVGRSFITAAAYGGDFLDPVLRLECVITAHFV